MEIAEYPYKPKPITAIGVIVFFGICAAFIGNQAHTNDRGLILNKIIEFSENGATTFYWVLTALCITFVVAGIFMLIKSISATRFVSLTQDSIISPKPGFSKKNIIIPYADIESLSLQKVQNQVFLMVHFSGKKISIPKSLLPDENAFNELCEKLSKNIEG